MSWELHKMSIHLKTKPEQYIFIKMLLEGLVSPQNIQQVWKMEQAYKQIQDNGVHQWPMQMCKNVHNK